MMVPKITLDILYSAVEAIVYNTDTLVYQDMIGIVDQLLYLFSIEECVAMANNKGADVEKAFVISTDGFTLSEGMDILVDGGTLPASFEIPREIFDTRVTRITQNTGFRQNSYIYEVRLPESVHTISEEAFSQCTNLTYINLDKVMTLGTNAFARCNSLKKVELSARTIPQGCFNSCNELKEVVFNDSTISIGFKAFGYCPSLEKVVIPSSVTSIDATSFEYCSPRLIIYGERGSYAETYANANGIAFLETVFE